MHAIFEKKSETVKSCMRSIGVVGIAPLRQSFSDSVQFSTVEEYLLISRFLIDPVASSRPSSDVLVAALKYSLPTYVLFAQLLERVSSNSVPKVVGNEGNVAPSQSSADATSSTIGRERHAGGIL